MSGDRGRGETSAPDPVCVAAGVVVALVSVVFGVAAHGMADHGGVPGGPALLGLGLVGAGIGALAAELSRRYRPELVAGGALVLGQGLVHGVLTSVPGGHAHTAAAHGTTAHDTVAPGHGVDVAALSAAMDAAALGRGSAGLLSPAMLGAHAVAIVLTVAVVAILAATLTWVAARMVVAAPVTPHAADTVLVVVSLVARAVREGYLVARGGTRAPPLAV